MKQAIIYDSFNAYGRYYQRRSNNHLRNVDMTSPDLHTYASKLLRKLGFMCKGLGINLELFKEDGSYSITRGCLELFDYLLDIYDEDDGKAIRNKHFSNVSEIHLIIIRGLLYDALRDADLPLDKIQDELRYFKGYTGSPERTFPAALSEPVKEALDLYQERTTLPKKTWNMIADYLQWYYLVNLRTRLITTLINEIPGYLEAAKLADDAAERVLARQRYYHKNAEYPGDKKQELP